MNIAIITARGGSKSISDKNVSPVLGEPLVSYPIKAAKESKRIDMVYISTDCPKIISVSQTLGCEIIDRPEDLRGDTVNHGDVIKHAVDYVDKLVDNLENIVLLLGNTVMLDAELIDQSLKILDENKDYDSVMSVWEAADDHPLRALQIKEGFLATYADEAREVSTERQSYPKAYYYDQGVWAFRKDCIDRRDGPNPWWWMGARCYPIVRNWITGRDVHTYLDVGFAEWWLKNYPEVKKL
ncbi:acylneuraminate cytidylyltransferase family protein [Candidatus Pacearchaeota archaeon]|nr:acylneuraminate cytidylyltransferase family protein [Candidatus Pacearchaeota archaeon]